MKVLARILSVRHSQAVLIFKLLILAVLAFAFKPMAAEIGYGFAILICALISPALLIFGNRD